MADAGRGAAGAPVCREDTGSTCLPDHVRDAPAVVFSFLTLFVVGALGSLAGFL